MKRLLILPVALPAAALLVLTGCSSSGSSTPAGGPSGAASTTPSGGASSGAASSGAASGRITVYAASSLTEAFTKLKTQFTKAHPGSSVAITFGPSSDLSTQITNGAPVDVFASASPKNMKAVKTAVNPTDFASNTLEIAVPPNNPGKITALKDLSRSGVKVAVCDPAVPCGVVAAKVFANAKLKVKPVANEADVKSTLAAIASGEVDAGLVYVTDVRAAGAKVKGIPIPKGVNASTKYPIASLSGSKNATLAKAFVAYVLSPAGRSVLTADGFSAP